jgi:hypothetical protein
MEKAFVYLRVNRAGKLDGNWFDRLNAEVKAYCPSPGSSGQAQALPISLPTGITNSKRLSKNVFVQWIKCKEVFR